jgi:hypothetical protein
VDGGEWVMRITKLSMNLSWGVGDEKNEKFPESMEHEAGLTRTWDK